MSNFVEIVVNGQPCQAPDGCTVAALLAGMALNQRYVAVEVNELLVPRTEHSHCLLGQGDRVEIVTLVGGG